MFIGSNLHSSFDFGKEILISNQNSSKSLLHLFWWVQVFGLVQFDLVCYSLDPVLVIWYVTLLLFFFENSLIFI